jgi:DNA-binding transcriptional regulator YhcF (GntR family)
VPPYDAVSVPAQVAASLRRKIYAGEYPPGTALPSAADLAAQYGRSRALMSQALGRLAAEELVSAEQGRGTFVRPRCVYQAVVEIPRTGNQQTRERHWLTRDARLAADTDEAIRRISVETGPAQARLHVTVECASPARAASVAYTAARAACWNGWDLAAANIAAAPEADPADPTT